MLRVPPLLLAYANFPIAQLLAYVTIPAVPNATLMLRWTMPEQFTDESGLGGGLTYAVERDFCGKMVGQFDDKDWIKCGDIDDSIRRAFETWAANHQMISFKNVSSRCLADGAVQACEQANAVRCASTTGAARVECFWQRGNCTKLCAAAEIVILAESFYGGRLVDSVAYVQHWDSLGQTAADSVVVRAPGPRLTNGVVSLRDAIIKKATITFLRRDCFYIDSTFCASLHKTERDFGSVLVLYALFTMPFFALAIVLLLARFCLACKAIIKHKRGWGLGIRDAIKSIAEPLTEIWLILFLTTLMPFLYFSLARPCMRCYDFEASMAHEIGLVLGLGQPNAPGHTNYEVISPLNASNCGPTAALLPGQPGSLAVTAPVSGEWTMMNTLLTRQVAPCPTKDDLAGLNMLYPTCSNARQSEPLCYKSFENLGVIRLMSSVGLAVAISFTVAACLSRGSQLYEKVKVRLMTLHAETSAAMEAAAVNIQARFRGHKARSQTARNLGTRRNLLAGESAHDCENQSSDSMLGEAQAGATQKAASKASASCLPPEKAIHRI